MKTFIILPPNIRKACLMMKILCSIFAVCIFSQQCSGQINRSPTFLSGFDMENFTISENTPPGSSVYTLRGRDPDQKKLSYYISGDSFSVNKDTGVVKLIGKLDREIRNNIQVIITITDEAITGTQPNTVSVQRFIPILDENDNSPIFQNVPYTFFVGETANVGSTVFDGILISDKDEGKNSELSLTCTGDSTSKSCDIFEVKSKPSFDGQMHGEIILKKNLDYEKQSSYDLIITVEDHASEVEKRLKSSTKVHINIKDVQDQPPLFLNDPYSATVEENSVQGQMVLKISAKDGDEGDPRPVALSIHNDIKGYFKVGNTVESSPGVYSASLLTSASPINREDRNVLNNGGLYVLEMKATELINGELTGDSTFTNVTIVVADVDDQFPVFNDREFSVDVMEGISSNTPLPGLNIVVWDNDVGKNAKFSLKLRNLENAEGVFSVYPESAVGRTPVIIKLSDSSKLDFERPSSRTMKFEVIASQEQNRASTATVTVNILDVNDNGPKFSRDQYVIEILESANSGEEITTLTANDADSGDFGRLTYSLNGFDAEKFIVDEKSGRIILGSCLPDSSCIDYEMLSSYSLTYTAKDGGGRVSTVNLMINVIDVNDNDPLFVHEQYHRQIQENAIEINPPLIIKASDSDGPTQGGGVVKYSIRLENSSASSPLAIDPNSGQISLARPLTYFETPDSGGKLMFVVVATDLGAPPRSSQVDLHIRVMKENDGAPVFVNEPYSAHLKENSNPGTSIIQIIASDPDGPDSGITYFISKGARDNFVISDRTGVISIAPNANLDLDLNGDEFQITIKAVDSGSPMQQTSTTNVKVHIMDVNNKPPKFPQESYTRYIDERKPVGEDVLNVTATDPDNDSKIRYTIVEPIIVRDKTGLVMDANSKKKYEETFGVNGTSGQIYVKSNLDYSSAAVFIFNIQAIDLNAVVNSGSPKKQIATAEVTIYIQAYDNKNPIFAPPWTSSNPKIEITIAEEPAIDSELMTLTAKDPTTGQKIQSFYKAESSDPGDYVSISPLSGIVTLNRRLNYEALPFKYIEFKVIATSENSEGTHTSEAEVKVNIQDINDNSPVFVQNMYKTSLLESAKYPQSLVTVYASDEDNEGNYGDIRYSLSGQGSELFQIDPITGTVKVSNGSVLDREDKALFNLQVTATDNPGENVNQRKTSVILTIKIVDVNDNIPKFSRDTYTAVVPENVPKDISITRIIAQDSDEGENGRVYYEMLKENDAEGLFKISKVDGSMYVKQSLAGKGRSDPYMLTVRSTDYGSVPLSNEVDVLVFIGDVASNDGVPKFVRPALGEVASVYENSTIGTSVYQVVAVDPDDPNTANGRVSFRFLSDTSNRNGNSIFAIDPITGVITTKQYLDREEKQNYTLIVVAYDLGDNPQETTRVLDVIVLDVDDNKPRFERPLNADPIRLSVLEEGPIGKVVGSIQALDEDENKNAVIEYYILDGNSQGLFGIRRTNNSNQGEVFTKKRIDRETLSSYLLVIKACKPGESPMRTSIFTGYDANDFGQIRVKIEVEDVDDNRPVFETNSNVLGVRVDTDIHSELITLVAHDRDASSGGLKYSLFNSTFTKYGNSRHVPDAFVIDKDSGTIRTNVPYGAFLGGYFSLNVVATPKTFSNVTNSSATTVLKVHVVKDTELMKFVFNKPPSDVRKLLIGLKRTLNTYLKDDSISLNVYDSQYNSDENGRLDLQSSSSCFQLVQDHGIIPSKISLEILDHNKHPDLIPLYQNYSIIDISHCASRPNSMKLSWIEISLIGIGTLVALVALFATIILSCLYASYKRRLRKATYYKTMPMSRSLSPSYIIE